MCFTCDLWTGDAHAYENSLFGRVCSQTFCCTYQQISSHHTVSKCDAQNVIKYLQRIKSSDEVLSGISFTSHSSSHSFVIVDIIYSNCKFREDRWLSLHFPYTDSASSEETYRPICKISDYHSRDTMAS